MAQSAENSVAVDIVPEVTPGVPNEDPPKYEEVVNEPNIPPPSYESLFGRIIEARKSSEGLSDFLKNCLKFISVTVGCCIGDIIVIPIGMIIIGSSKIKQCPQAEFLPEYLIIGGFLGVIKQFLNITLRVCKKTGETAEESIERLRETPAHTMLDRAILGWFIIGSIWVYALYEPNYDSTIYPYCDKMLYLTTFWFMTSVYICLAAITIFLCSVTVTVLWLYRDQEQ